MSASADVRSLAQLQNLRERCTVCRAQTLKEGEELLAELQKLTRWLDEEAAPYWERQRTLAVRWMQECQEALMRCQATVRADEKRPCTDERKRLERATQRRSLCDQKMKAVEAARLLWQRQVVKLRGRLQSTCDMAESDLLRTVHKLSDIIGTLEAYTQMRSVPASGPTSASASEPPAASTAGPPASEPPPSAP
jgi:hypothetical protein